VMAITMFLLLVSVPSILSQSVSQSTQAELGQEWVTGVFTQLSPRAGQMGEAVLNTRVAPVVDGALSALQLGRKAFKFTRISMGQVKPVITNIRTHPKVPGIDRIVIDFDLLYLGDADIQVSILGISAGVRDVRVEGRARLVIAPTIAELPLVGGIQLFFLTRPNIGFRLQGAASLADKIPAIQEKIIEDLVDDLGKEAIWPNRITLPLSYSCDPRQVWQPQLRGILLVKLRSVEGLPRKVGSRLRRLTRQDKPDPYGLVRLGMKEGRTSSGRNTQQHSWDTWTTFLVEEVEGHLLEIVIMDEDRASNDEYMGQVKIDLTSALSIRQGNLSVRPPSVTESLVPVPGKRTKYTNTQGQVTVEFIWRPLVSSPSPTTPPPPSSPSLPPNLGPAAVLTVFVYSANNLDWYISSANRSTAVPQSHQPSPRVSVSVGSGNSQTGQPVTNTRQAEIKQGFILELGEDWSRNSLKIEVIDSKGGSSHGSSLWSLSSLVGLPQTRSTVPLSSSNPGQTLTVSLLLSFPAPFQ